MDNICDLEGCTNQSDPERMFCSKECVDEYNSRLQRKRSVKSYYNDPNYCKECGDVIELRDDQCPAEAYKQKFCSRSCSAKHNNSERRRYDWDKVQKHHNKVNSVKKTVSHFGMVPMTWYKAVERGDVEPNIDKSKKPLHELENRSSVRKRIVNNDLLPYECFECGIDEWRGESLSLHLDHINGNPDDHRLENLRWLCPNCHSQTDDYCGRSL